MSFTVGLTGGVGSGKTSVSTRLAALGATVVDTDEISRRLTAAGGAAMAALREAFGGRFVTAGGALDRAAMRALVFEDPAARARLEAVLHPAIRAEAERELAGARGAYSVLVVPLFFETGGASGPGGYRSRIDRTLVVDCPEALQVERTAKRSGLAPAEVRSIMAAQWPRWRRLQAADDVIWNGGDEGALDAQCAALDARYREAARAAR
ncbi:MAG TPA: dephospho-CoA kinase [Usitatibacter sp.]|nr:dephospho-CoA kinase [Usitatibacter sp.]